MARQQAVRIASIVSVSAALVIACLGPSPNAGPNDPEAVALAAGLTTDNFLIGDWQTNERP
jgi:hypothetical protein